MEMNDGYILNRVREIVNDQLQANLEATQRGTVED